LLYLSEVSVITKKPKRQKAGIFLYKLSQNNIIMSTKELNKKEELEKLRSIE